VERNEVETRIIPTTWRELGLGLHGLAGAGVVYDIGVTTGFNSGSWTTPPPGSAARTRRAHLPTRTTSRSTARLTTRPPGVLIGGGVFTGNTGQNGQANRC